MFSSPEIAHDLTWHARGRVNNGKLTHPRDSPAWKLVDNTWKEFGKEDQNIRLALSADGINPHKAKPGNNIDVYLAPLIEDLKLLWETGVNTFDAYKKEYFNLRAILCWTINDFPTYGNLSGCVTKEIYNNLAGFKNTWGKKKKKKREMSKKETSKKKLAKKKPPKKKTPIEKTSKKEKESIDERTKLWHKKSNFFELEYWKKLLVRHQLDVMHIEKNVCESVYGTLLNLPHKMKDGLHARQDLEELGIKLELQTQQKGNRLYLPPACYTLNTSEKHLFYDTLSNIKVPDGYCSNFKNLVSDDGSKMNGLKSNDCHVLMQQLLPIAIKGVLHEKVRKTIISLCHFFNRLCSKVVDVSKLSKLQSDIVLTLCLLKKYFPPSFFDVMIHLMVHLVREVRLCGPVHFRWMYPFERYMKTLKGTRTGKPLSRATIEVVDANLLDQAHLYVLRNTAVVEPCIELLVQKISNPVYGAVTYFGRIKEIWDLDYHMFTVPVFMCDWADSRGVKKDDFGFTVVNFDRLGHQTERFILASQARQVFYVKDQQDEKLSVVGFTPHKMYKYGVTNETDDILEFEATVDVTQDSLADLDEDFLCARTDADGILV
ncbi:uncharacterized protein LOC143557927 [Bidens hawaiensis]|uniref:uncharacterized protein LOC143557927 n=1 Tax=Bidens hawaiensis TaxID=980011 RepID=UPI004049ABC0